MSNARRTRQLYVVNRSSSSSEGDEDPSRGRYRRPTRSPAFPRTKPGSSVNPPPMPRVPAPPSKPPTPLSTSNLLSTSLSSPSSAADETPPPSTPDPRLSPFYVRPQPKPPRPPLGKVWILVTRDAERYTRIDISGAQDPIFIRDAIFSKLEILDELDCAQHAIFQTEFGTSAIGDPLSNDRLWDLCREEGDAKASLLFFVLHSSSYHRELPPRPPFSPGNSPYLSQSPSRSRNGSVSSTSEYDADLDNNEDDNKRATIRPPPHPVSISLPTSSIIPPSPNPPPLPRAMSPQLNPPRPPSPPQPSTSVSPKPDQRTITDRAGNIYPPPPPPPPLSPHRPNFGYEETTPTTIFHTPTSAVSSTELPEPSSSLVPENGIKSVRRPPYALPKTSNSSPVRDGKRTKRLPELRRKDDSPLRPHDSHSPEVVDSPSRSSPISARSGPSSARAPISPNPRYKNGFSPRPIPPTPRGGAPLVPGARNAGQPLPPSWAVNWKPETSKPLSSSSANWTRLTKGAKSMDNLRSSMAVPHGTPGSGGSRRTNQLPMSRPHPTREPPVPPIATSVQRSHHHRPLPMQGGPALSPSFNTQLDIRAAISASSRPSLLATPTSNEPYSRPTSAFGDGTIISPTQKFASRLLQSPTFAGESSESRASRGVSPIRPLHPAILLSSRSVPPNNDLEQRSSLESPTQSPPSPHGGRFQRERLHSDTGLPDYRGPMDSSRAEDASRLSQLIASTSPSYSSLSSSYTGESTLVPDDDSDGSEGSIWARGPNKPELVIQTGTPSQSASTLGPSPPLPKAPSAPSAPSRCRQDVKSDGSTFKDIEEKTWAFRPPPEDVYEEMEKYFPNHDLDKPVLESNSGGASPTIVEPGSPIAHVPPVAPLITSKAKKALHKKSLRMAAGEHISNRKRVSYSDVPGPSAISRRMTRLWGSKLEEVTTDQARTNLSATPESPSGGQATFKWVRGELIGKGTYGQVYLALNATTGEMMAVKQVEIPRTASDMNDTRQATVVQALKLESDTLKDLDHPNIVQYLGFEETPSNLSIFLEYVPGGSVGSCLQKHGKFDEDVTKSFTAQILSGLEYLHSKNILHRDLKADNILVEHNGICKISDFGISKRTDDLSGGAHTAMQGTVFWMAPEVLSTAEKGYNSKIDIWSVGCVVLEMWAGSRPWSGSEMMAVMFKLYHEKKPPPVPADVTLSALADDFRQQCFAINPEDRPSAAALSKHPYLELPPRWTFNGFK